MFVISAVAKKTVFTNLFFPFGQRCVSEFRGTTILSFQYAEMYRTLQYFIMGYVRKIWRDLEASIGVW